MRNWTAAERIPWMPTRSQLLEISRPRPGDWPVAKPCHGFGHDPERPLENH